MWHVAGQPALSGGGFQTNVGSFLVSPQVGELVPTSFDVAARGDGLVVAMVDRVPGSPDRVQLTGISKSGIAAWLNVFATDGTVEGPLSLLVSPDGASLLVAWSELPPGATAHRLRVARLDCFDK